VTWHRDPLGHGLTSRGVQIKRSFGYKPDFIHQNHVKLDGKDVKPLPPREMYELMTDPESVENRYRVVFLSTNFERGPGLPRTAEAKEEMAKFARKYGEAMKTVDVEPDFLLDTIKVKGLGNEGGAAPVLYFVSNGNPDIIASNESLRTAIIVYFLSEADDQYFWRDKNFAYLSALSPEERMVVVPRLIRKLRDIGANDPRVYSRHLKDFFMVSTSGIDDASYKVIRKDFVGLVVELENDEDFMKRKSSDALIKNMTNLLETMDYSHSKTKTIFYRRYANRIRFSTVVDTDDEKDRKYMRDAYPILLTNESQVYQALHGDITEWQKVAHINRDQLPKLVEKNLFEE